MIKGVLFILTVVVGLRACQGTRRLGSEEVLPVGAVEPARVVRLVEDR